MRFYHPLPPLKAKKSQPVFPRKPEPSAAQALRATGASRSS